MLVKNHSVPYGRMNLFACFVGNALKTKLLPFSFLCVVYQMFYQETWSHILNGTKHKLYHYIDVFVLEFSMVDFQQWALHNSLRLQKCVIVLSHCQMHQDVINVYSPRLIDLSQNNCKHRASSSIDNVWISGSFKNPTIEGCLVHFQEAQALISFYLHDSKIMDKATADTHLNNWG